MLLQKEEEVKKQSQTEREREIVRKADSTGRRTPNVK